MLKKFREFLSDKGQGVVEYALLLGFVAVVVAGLLSSGLNEEIQKSFDYVKAMLVTTASSDDN